MFWKCIISPQKIFSFQTVFLFTSEDDCIKKFDFLLSESVLTP
jgi:hypothetical protein